MLFFFSGLALLFVASGTTDDGTLLKNFFWNTEGGSWVRATNWLLGSPCSDEWFGVVCSENVITELNLPANNLRTKTFSNLTFPDTIERLDLSGNVIGGSVLLDNLPSALTHLVLAENRLSGLLPQLNSNSRLSALRLEKNFFDGDVPDAYFAAATMPDDLGLGCNRFSCSSSLFTLSTISVPIFECVCPVGMHATTGVLADGSQMLKCDLCEKGTTSVGSYVGLNTTQCDGMSIYGVDYLPYFDDIVLAFGKGTSIKGQCVGCFKKDRCEPQIQNARVTTCVLHSGGKSCEKCDKGYHDVHGSCLSCKGASRIPLGGLAFIILIAVTVITIRLHGHFSSQTATKVRLFVNFLQLCVLSVTVQIPWPYPLSLFAFGAQFVDITLSSFSLDCYVQSSSLLYYDWCFALSLVIASTLILLWMDKLLNRHVAPEPPPPLLARHSFRDIVPGRKSVELMPVANGKEDKRRQINNANRPWLERRLTYRRILILILLSAYAPLASISFRSFACEDALGDSFAVPTSELHLRQAAMNKPSTSRSQHDMYRNSFYFDQRLDCNDLTYQLMQLVNTFLLLIAIVGLAVLLFVLLRLKKWKLLRAQHMLFGPIYEPYQASWCFFETVVLARKLCMIALTEFIPLNPLSVSILFFSSSMIYWCVIVLANPLRKARWFDFELDVNNLFEIFSTIGVALLQLTGLLIAEGRNVDTFAMVVGCVLLLIVAAWIALMLSSHKYEGGQDDLAFLNQMGDTLGDGDRVGKTDQKAHWTTRLFRRPKRSRVREARTEQLEKF
eukprot:m.61853 g.61853  ORF g.61853 m.61853 type:complete len:784 (+) comp19308_c0_seq3:38-2389(+)